VAQSERELTAMLGDFRGKTFIDVGCASGMSSLAAQRLLALVRSFDFDSKRVEWTRAVRCLWPVELGSVLDRAHLRRLGVFDVVCSWGSLHHTGDMWRAIDNAAQLVLYRDAWLAPVWKLIKRCYSASPRPAQWIIRNAFAGIQLGGLLLKGRNPRRVMREYGKRNRGMSWYTDVTDWIGGYPFEYASAEQVVAHLESVGFATVKVHPEPYPKPMGWQGTGSYQYVFRRVQ
jgi:2-polyprenyl-6-hydroxyphenyl methylase/3-demethylubiquinone-9 3-methyltransferase